MRHRRGNAPYVWYPTRSRAILLLKWTFITRSVGRVLRVVLIEPNTYHRLSGVMMVVVVRHVEVGSLFTETSKVNITHQHSPSVSRPSIPTPLHEWNTYASGFVVKPSAGQMGGSRCAHFTWKLKMLRCRFVPPFQELWLSFNFVIVFKLDKNLRVSVGF